MFYLPPFANILTSPGIMNDGLAQTAYDAGRSLSMNSTIFERVLLGS